MTLESLIKTAAGPGLVVLLLTFVEFSKIKINPWTAIGKVLKKALNGIGRAANSDVLVKLDEITHAQSEAQQKLENLEARLDEHIQVDDERDADMHRAKILQFNTELLREKKHTEEDFNEIFYNINCYKRYCQDHPNYQNGRAVHAIANIDRVYDDRQKKHDFL